MAQLFDQTRLSRIDDWMAGYIDQRKLPGAVMLLAVSLAPGLGLFPSMALGATAYVGAVFLFRAFPSDDLAHLLHAVRGRSS